jgi:hypothetical protein
VQKRNRVSLLIKHFLILKTKKQSSQPGKPGKRQTQTLSPSLGEAQRPTSAVLGWASDHRPEKRKEKKMKALDLRGKKFGRLTAVLPTSQRSNGGSILWVCLCSCGEYCLTASPNLSQHRGVRSCGCLRRERLAEFGKNVRPPTKHGHCRRDFRSLTYNTWLAMRGRCLNPNHGRYKDWGGRGIRVCREWRGEYGFKCFLADMGARPPGTTIHRKDNDGNYELRNCCWADWREQHSNCRGGRGAA